MTQTNQPNRKGEKGFTLVELAIVMIVIGLLLGGVLQGQELIQNAQISNLSAQMRGFQTAHTAFLDRYGQAPGDLENAGARIPGCAAPCTSIAATDNDGSLNIAVGAQNTIADEGAQYFLHLFRAGFIGDMNGTASGPPPTFGNELPTSTIGGGFQAGSLGGPVAAAAVTGFVGANMRQGFYIVHNGTNVPVAASTGVLNANQAGAVDRKLDDGNPIDGVIHGAFIAGEAAATQCYVPVAAGAAPGTIPPYNEGSNQSSCALAFRTF